MRPVRRLPALPALTALAIAGCGGTSPTTAPTTSPPTAAPSVTSPPSTSSPATTSPPATTAAQAWPTAPRSTKGTGGLLVAIRAARHPGFDRVVFQFRGGPPPASVRYEPYVLEDPRGGLVPLLGRAYLRLTFQHASTVDQNVPSPPGYRKTYTGPTVITTRYPSLAQVRLAGDFEAVLSFGLGLERRAGFRALTLSDPPRLAIDVSHQAAPGICWDLAVHQPVAGRAGPARSRRGPPALAGGPA